MQYSKVKFEIPCFDYSCEVSRMFTHMCMYNMSKKTSVPSCFNASGTKQCRMFILVLTVSVLLDIPRQPTCFVVVLSVTCVTLHNKRCDFYLISLEVRY